MNETALAYGDELGELAKRIGQIEAKLGITGDDGGNVDTAEQRPHFCSLPEVPERVLAPGVSPHREFLIRQISKKWVSGTKLRYYFFRNSSWAGDARQEALVRKAFDVWRNVGIGISFEEVSEISEAEIRIGFLQGDGAWSYIGRDIIDIPKQNERTMNFGWDLTLDPRGVDVPVHEIGHTLGFPHEHQNPFSGIVWDEEAVYRYFGDTPNNWSRATTFQNILRKLSPSEVEGTQWDPNSVMHYAFAAGLIKEPPPYRNGIRPAGGLSAHDVEAVRRFYAPVDDKKNVRLEPFRLESLSLLPAEQRNFTLEPQSTRQYTIQTFGGSDTVIVLFEDINGELRYVDGDDDSGTDRNAQLSVRLNQGKRYVLRVRLYLNYASHTTGVMLW